MLTHLSLFSGVGGIDIAAEWAGFETVGLCECDEFCQAALRKLWPNVPMWSDVRDVTRESFRQRTGLDGVDLVSGGFPCQPISIAGRRRGTADHRWLWPQMLRVVDELHPAWVLAENPAGLITMEESHSPAQVESRTLARYPEEDILSSILTRQEEMLLDNICEDLEAAGYKVQPLAIPACAIGTPQERQRVFIVGHTAGTRRHARSQSSAGPELTKGSTGMADTRRQRGRTFRSEPKEDQPEADVYDQRCGEDMAESDEQQENRASVPRSERGSGSTEPGLGGVLDGVEARLDAARWPSLPGEEQHDWEPPRTAKGVSSRCARLKALGNAVVPQQVYPILAVMAALTGAGE